MWKGDVGNHVKLCVLIYIKLFWREHEKSPCFYYGREYCGQAQSGVSFNISFSCYLCFVDHSRVTTSIDLQGHKNVTENILFGEKVVIEKYIQPDVGFLSFSFFLIPSVWLKYLVISSVAVTKTKVSNMSRYFFFAFLFILSWIFWTSVFRKAKHLEILVTKSKEQAAKEVA